MANYKENQRLHGKESGVRKMWDTQKLRKHAKEIAKQCEEKGYTVEEAEMLVHILKDEVSQCRKVPSERRFKTLAN